MPRVAQFFALAGVMVMGVSAIQSAPLPSSERKLVIFLTSDSPMSSSSDQEMKEELSRLMEIADVQIDWKNPQKDRGGVENTYSAVFHLRGSCKPSQPSIQFEHAVKGSFPLATSAVSNGVVLPFGEVDCAALNSFLGPSLWRQKDNARDFMYGRAVARLMAHELYHVVGQTSTHEHEGVAKPAFTVAELLSDHFEFSTEAAKQFHSEAREYSTPTDSDDVSGK